MQPQVNHAVYDVEKQHMPDGRPALVLTDHAGGNGPDDAGGRSITNDAVRVIADLALELGGLGRMPVIYRDTDGVYDGLAHDGFRFCGFFPIRVGCLNEALATLAPADPHRDGYWPQGLN